MDKKNLALLNALTADGRASLKDLARMLKVSPVTIMNRMQAMEKEGTIKHYSTALDYEKLGYDVEVMVQLRISKGKLHDLEEKIAKHPNVVAVYDITGNFDAAIIARFKNRRGMDAFLKKIQTYDFVERTNTSLILRTIKEEPIKLW